MKKGVDSQGCVEMIAEKLGLTSQVARGAKRILREAEEKNLTSGKSPSGVAAAVVYISSIVNREPVTQRKIAQAAGVSEATILKRYKDLARRLEIRVYKS